MFIRFDSLVIENGEARFFMVTNAGNCGFPVNAGLSQIREMREVLGRIETQLSEHLAEQDIAPMFDENPEAVDRLLDDVQANTTGLPERIEQSAAVCGEEEEGERMAGDRWE